MTGGLTNPSDANAGVLAAGRRIRPADDFLLAGLVDESVAGPDLHREDTLLGGRRRRGLLSRAEA